ncbi:MAG: methylated-DNA--protein-cysteine methyltransferase [Nitrospirales bacterium]|nr:MAG: methylated-DNA--protein-cysteine methyltransferase [Nitrospirales bacterium]
MKKEIFYYVLQSPVGRLLLVGDHGGLQRLQFQDGTHPHPIESGWKKDRNFFNRIISQLEEYFDGRRKRFSIKLSQQGTGFQQQVWKALRTIPYGETVSYSTIARAIGKPTASRAVGAANGQNPISIIVPCHRVIGANGQLVGYGGGLPIKQSLLALEQQYCGKC